MSDKVGYSKRIDVKLTTKEYEFIKWLAKRDNVPFQVELRQLFYLQLTEEMELYEKEMEMEKD